jgi:hypothetical protein
VIIISNIIKTMAACSNERVAAIVFSVLHLLEKLGMIYR